MGNEFGIACLLDRASIEQLTTAIPFVENENYPHISLFQFRCEDKNFLTLIKKYLCNIVISSDFLTINVSQTENNIFLNIADDSTLKTASDQLAEFYSANYQGKKILSQINLDELNSLQIYLVNKYGIYWIKEGYHPHVTIAYEKKLDCNIAFKFPHYLKILPPNIYAIDHLGRIKI
jgi:hypothetical protein